MPAPTKRQRDVLDIITRYFESNGYRPSYQQIAKHLGLKSRAGIARIVRDLEAKGLLERRRENGHFSIEMKDGGAGVTLAWLNVAGPDEALDRRPITLPSFMLGTYDQSEIRVFRATDSSLAPEIEIDDIVLVELRDYSRDGQPVVALLSETEAVLRMHYRVNAEIELRATNNSMETITRPANRVRILGICRGLIRPAV